MYLGHDGSPWPFGVQGSGGIVLRNHCSYYGTMQYRGPFLAVLVWGRLYFGGVYWGHPVHGSFHILELGWLTSL